MPTNLIYMPTFRVRQQETIVLRSFEFGDNMYPLVEIVKKHDRARKEEAQKSFNDIHNEIIADIKAEHVFVDLPVYLKERGSMQDEVLSFSRSVINNWNTRAEHLLMLSHSLPKIIPVISSYTLKTGEGDTLTPQFTLLSQTFNRIAFRLFYQSFLDDWTELQAIIRPEDFLIVDLDTLAPYPTSPVLKRIVTELKSFTICPKILLRSAINTDIQNVALDHGNIVYEADNSIIETFRLFTCDAFGDFVGIKKDDLTAGGTISPGFVYYDAVDNQYYGFRASYKSLSEFEDTIVPAVLESEATARMLAYNPPFLDGDDWGWVTLNNIQQHAESGKSQAKFKRIAMEHYLSCIKKMINEGRFA